MIGRRSRPSRQRLRLTGQQGRQITKAEAGLKWGISKTNSLDLGYQWVRFNPDNATCDTATETYLTVGWAHQFRPNAGLKVGYQFINYDDGAPVLAPRAIGATPNPIDLVHTVATIAAASAWFSLV